jgi:hypothetical protein
MASRSLLLIAQDVWACIHLTRDNAPLSSQAMLQTCCGESPGQTHCHNLTPFQILASNFQVRRPGFNTAFEKLKALLPQPGNVLKTLCQPHVLSSWQQPSESESKPSTMKSYYKNSSRFHSDCMKASESFTCTACSVYELTPECGGFLLVETSFQARKCT